MSRPNIPDLDLEMLFELTSGQSKMKKEASLAKLRFAENTSRFTKVGFDLYKDKESEFIWRLEVDADTGEEFITRTASVDPLYQVAPNWAAEVDTNKNAITLLYKGNAVRAFKKADLQFDDENVEDWRRFILDKVSTDPSFLKHVLQAVGEQKRRLLASKCPELFK